MHISMLRSRRGFLKTATVTAADVVLPGVGRARPGHRRVRGRAAAGAARLAFRRSGERLGPDWSYDESFANARRAVGPNALGGTFGPQVVFDAPGGALTVDLRDINGVSVFSRTLQPRMG